MKQVKADPAQKIHGLASIINITLRVANWALDICPPISSNYLQPAKLIPVLSFRCNAKGDTRPALGKDPPCGDYVGDVVHFIRRWSYFEESKD